ncbi:MAG: FtsK/SpoIIIE domain-containing protein, partial [Anaerolineae bacterium]
MRSTIMATTRDLQVITTQERRGEGAITTLRRDTPLWFVVRSLGEQVVMALDDLGYVRADPLGRRHGFKVKELAVTPDGRLAVVHLDVTSMRVFEPAARGAAQRGRPAPYLALASDRVVEQIRVRVSELLGNRVDVWADNHYHVRYVVDVQRMGGRNEFPSGKLVEHLEAAPGPFTVPLGLDRRGELAWLNLAEAARHLLLTGTTGGGKTTWMDAAVCALAGHTPPDQLKLAFLDPQRLNFSPYAALRAYRFEDRQGALGVVWRPEEIVAAMVRLNQEHRRRVELIGDTPWGSVEQYNARAAPEERLPYVFVFTDELTVLREALGELGTRQVKTFESALKSLIVGGRKVGFRVLLCLQYLKRTTIPPEVAAQAALTLAFWNSPQGSKNTLGDTSAAMLPGRGRFILDGLPGGRKVLQGLYVDRETVLALVGKGVQRRAQPVDSLVQDVIAYALQEEDGRLSRDALNRAFGHLTSVRQINHLLKALEQVGLASPA